MKWMHESASELGNEISCSVCHKKQNEQDIVYWPQFGYDDEERYEQIEKLFGSVEEFHICEDCMEGHCGVNPGLTANSWLEKKLKLYGKER